MSKNEQYTVHYRIGGWARFQWCKTLLVGTYEEMREEAKKVETGGYRTLVVPVRYSESIGLPETFSFAYDISDVRRLKDGWFAHSMPKGEDAVRVEEYKKAKTEVR